MGTNIVMKPRQEPMLVAESFQDMVFYVMTATTDFDLQDRMMKCALKYRKLTNRYALPIILNNSRKEGDPIYVLNFKEIDKDFAEYVDEYIKRYTK